MMAACMEALELPHQLRILYKAFQIALTPDVTAPERYKLDWLDIQALRAEVRPTHDIDKAIPIEWGAVINELISQLGEENTSTATEVWKRLFLADSLDLVSPKQRIAVGALLWSIRDRGEWPSLHGFLPFASLRWPAPSEIDRNEIFKRSVLARKLRPFESGGYFRFQPRNGRSYSLPGDFTLIESLLVSLDKSAWSLDQLVVLLQIVEDWLAADESDLLTDAPKNTEVFLALSQHVHQVDKLLARVLLVLIDAEHSMRSKDAQYRLWQIYDRMGCLGIPLWRLRLLQAAKDRNKLSWIAVTGDLEMALLSKDESVLSPAQHATHWALARSVCGDLPRLESIFDRLVSTISSRLVPGLAGAMDILRAQPSTVWSEYLSLHRLYLLDSALGVLRKELAIERYPSRKGIPDDGVPALRERCAQLAGAVAAHSKFNSPNAQAWLTLAKTDPLPELRLGKFDRGSED